MRRAARVACALIVLLPVLVAPATAQEHGRPPVSDEELDSLYIAEVEDASGPPKVLHAEPLFIDLIRDLGARRGEAEWNFGFELAGDDEFDAYEVLVEYEFAPVNRIGIEFEVPATFYAGRPGSPETPSDRIEFLRTAVQWTYLVSPRHSLSAAVGYLNELEFADLDRWGEDPLIRGNTVNPIAIVAKRWGANLHTLLYAGPKRTFAFRGESDPWAVEANWNLHYMLPGTRNFVGLELNQRWQDGDFDMVARPQMRLGVTDNFLVGIATGIPLVRSGERLSFFVRLIWEPGQAHLTAVQDD
jgi:hypothetical protein